MPSAPPPPASACAMSLKISGGGEAVLRLSLQHAMPSVVRLYHQHAWKLASWALISIPLNSWELMQSKLYITFPPP
jgi:hypothetical protein